METSATTEEMVERISRLPEHVGVNACFGQPIEKDGHILVPVARTSFGFGMGFGRGSGRSPAQHGMDGEGGEGEGGGGGGGGSATPVAVIDLARDDVQIRPVMDPMRAATAGLLLAGWVAFWLLLTVRTVARETQKTERKRVEKFAPNES
ncbi:MAG TPA: spore germination protein GerW family protein [Dehalococcoidia bacterium]|nr:spore germination protein GerW family protein [Dehalococcoidia bacterium]